MDTPPTRRAFMNTTDISDLSELGLPIQLPGRVRFNVGPAVAEGIVEAVIPSRDLAEEFAHLAGAAPEAFPLSTRVFAFHVREGDEVVVRTADGGLPLVVRRDGEVIVNFDIRATQAFQFSDSKRPIYTYIPGFNIQSVPEGIRRPVSNLVESLRGPRRVDMSGNWRRLPLTDFDFTVLLLNTILAHGLPQRPQPFHWPAGKRAVFVSLHDVDTPGLLRRRDRDPLLRIEAEHQIRSTWFVPTALLDRPNHSVDFLLESGHDVGWHGHKHDHRDHVKPYADRAVDAFNHSRLGDPANHPVGMRLPKLLKSNYIFQLLERSSPTLCYDTSFLRGIVPYNLSLDGKQSRILEIPCTVPTDILVYNQLGGLGGASKADAILKAQIARTEKLIEVGALISIVTHPEPGLSERPDFLEVYSQYLDYICNCRDIWFATAGELFKYWSQNNDGSGPRITNPSQPPEVATQ